jgi:hypothetical protein
MRCHNAERVSNAVAAEVCAQAQRVLAIEARGMEFRCSSAPKGGTVSK